MRLPSAERAAVAGAGRSTGLGGLEVMWCGHSTFVLTSPKGVRLLFDPWLTTNPSCPAAARKIGAIDLMLISHGHPDHCADAVSVARETGAIVVAPVELVSWLERQGVKNTRPMNVGGRQTIKNITVAMVNAVHSSSTAGEGDATYLGPATGYVVRFEEGLTVYFAGDTALFGDMRVIRDRFAPDIAFLPIGDRYTMGPEDAAIAAEWLGVKTVIPMHYATFPELTGTPDHLRQFTALTGIGVLELRPGETTS